MCFEVTWKVEERSARTESGGAEMKGCRKSESDNQQAIAKLRSPCEN